MPPNTEKLIELTQEVQVNATMAFNVLKETDLLAELKARVDNYLKENDLYALVNVTAEVEALFSQTLEEAALTDEQIRTLNEQIEEEFMKVIAEAQAKLMDEEKIMELQGKVQDILMARTEGVIDLDKIS